MKGTMELINKRTGKMQCKICGSLHVTAVSLSKVGGNINPEFIKEEDWKCVNECEENDFSLKLCLKELSKFPSKKLIEGFLSLYVDEIVRIGHSNKKYAAWRTEFIQMGFRS